MLWKPKKNTKLLEERRLDDIKQERATAVAQANGRLGAAALAARELYKAPFRVVKSSNGLFYQVQNLTIRQKSVSNYMTIEEIRELDTSAAPYYYDYDKPFNTLEQAEALIDYKLNPEKYTNYYWKGKAERNIVNDPIKYEICAHELANAIEAGPCKTDKQQKALDNYKKIISNVRT